MANLNERSILTIPRFIEAKSKQELSRLMLLAQRRYNAKLHFFDIQFAQGKWVAWYELNLRQGVVNTDVDVK